MDATLAERQGTTEMSHSNWFYLISAYFLAFLTMPACADTDQDRLPYIGRPGQLPVEVVTQFLKSRLSGADHFVDYKTLTIVQHSKRREMSDQVHLIVIQKGLLDDSIQDIRWRLQLRLNPQRRWQINTVKEDFSCYLAIKIGLGRVVPNGNVLIRYFQLGSALSCPIRWALREVLPSPNRRQVAYLLGF